MTADGDDFDTGRAPLDSAEMLTLQQFGELVKQARLAKGWTQRRLAHHAGVSEQTVARLERGEKVSHRIVEIAAEVGVAVPTELRVRGRSFSPLGVRRVSDRPNALPHSDVTQSEVPQMGKAIQIPPYTQPSEVDLKARMAVAVLEMNVPDKHLPSVQREILDLSVPPDADPVWWVRTIHEIVSKKI